MPTFTHRPLAIIGMACRLPGADGLAQYWDLLRLGRSAIGELPANRFNADLYYDPQQGVRGKSYSKLGGVVGPRQKPFETFRLTEEEVRQADIPHLEICSLVADACRNARVDPQALAGVSAGVYVGHTRGSGLAGDRTVRSLVKQTAPWLAEVDGFAKLAGGRTDDAIAEIIASTRARLPASDANVEAYQASRLISRAYGLNGPYISLNAACASSVMALSLAANALDLGTVELAVVGGASYCKADSLVLFSKAQSLSATGSRPFDIDADGFVSAEGYVILLVKTLDRALADGNTIQAVISGIGVSSDGRGKSLWAPREEGQVEAFRRAYATPADIARLQYLEAHATSTQVGDATELSALSRCVLEAMPLGKKIPIGSVKANIGHTLETAGLAGLVKTVLSIQNRMIPPVINLRELSTKFGWNKSPFTVPTQALQWQSPADGSSRRAGVNAFGIGGCNTHVVVDEYLPTRTVSASVPSIPSSQPNDEAIAIIGMSAIVPGAQTLDALWELLSSGRSMLTDPPVDRHYLPKGNPHFETPTLRGGYLTDYQYDWRKHKVPPKQVNAADPQQFLLLDAVDRALEDARLKEREYDRMRTTVIVGSLFATEFASQLHLGLRLPEFALRVKDSLRARGAREEDIDVVYERFVELFLQRMPALEDETGSFTSSTLASRITKSFDWMGGSMAIDSGEASSLVAVALGIDMLRTGRSETVVCCSAHRNMGPNIFESLSHEGLLDDSFRPLDADSRGTLPGEGAVVLVLKRLADAERDGDPIRAVIRGVGVARDSNPRAALSQAMQRALQSTKLHPSDVSMIEVAGSGIPTEDAAELACIQQVYGDTREHKLQLSSVSGQVGFLGGASGMLSLIKAVLQLQKQQVAPGAGVNKSVISPSSTNLSVVTKPEPIPVVRTDGRTFAAASSVTRRELAIHVLIERPQPIDPSPVKLKVNSNTAQAQLPILFRLSADTWPALREAAARVSQEAVEALRTSAGGQSERACRVVFVTTGAANLAEQATLLSQVKDIPATATLLAARNIFVRDTASPGKLAFIFPGQGSQYPRMGLDWAEHSTAAREALASIDADLHGLRYPSLRELVCTQAETLGEEVFQTQLALVATSALLSQLLMKHGLMPDRITSHSFGEYAALYAAGAWDFSTAAIAIHHRCEAITGSAGLAGQMASCAADEATVAALLRNQRDIFLANMNSRDQTVIGGSEEAVVTSIELLQKHKIAVKLLPVPRPFHTPLMQPVQAPLAQSLANLAIQPPRLPILSSVTNKYVADPEDIRDNLVRQMTQPVRFTDLIERLYREGVRTFVEVGPRFVITRLVGSILTARDHLAIAIDENKRPIEERLSRLAALAELYGTANQPVATSAAQLASTHTVNGNGHADSHHSNGNGAHHTPSTALNFQPDDMLLLSGTPYEMGLAHGRAQREEIRRVMRSYCDLPAAATDFLVDLSPALANIDDLLPREMREEIDGIATGAGVSVDALIAHNLRVYPDISMGCSQVVVRGSDGVVHGANEDLPLSLLLREQLVRNVQLRRPQGGLAHLTFGIAGQCGGITGVNAAGIIITNAMLLDLPRRVETRPGVLHGYIARNILESASSLDDALAITRKYPVTGAWAICITHSATQQSILIESDGDNVCSRPIDNPHVSANHSLLHASVAPVPEHSLRRQRRLAQLLAQSASDQLAPQNIQAWLRDRVDIELGREARFPTMNTVRRVDNQISVVFAPQLAQAWVADSTKGSDEYRTFDLTTLLGLQPSAKREEPRHVENKPTENLTITPEEFRLASTSVDGHSPKNAGVEVCNRFVMRLLPKPLPPPQRSALASAGTYVLVGDNAISRTLAAELTASHAVAVVLSTCGTTEDILAKFDAIWDTHPVRHLVLTVGWDDAACTGIDLPTWMALRQRADVVFHVTQRWFQKAEAAALLDESGLWGVTRLGGNYAFTPHAALVENGATTGIVKAVSIEHARRSQDKLQTRVIDFSGMSPANSVAKLVVDEFTVRGGEIEVAYINGQRHVTRPVHEPFEPLPRITPPQDGPWVITGGARGVTAEMVRTLGREVGAPLHLIGSSPRIPVPAEWHGMTTEQELALRGQVMRDALAQGQVPATHWERTQKAIEIEKNLRDFAAAGYNVTYHACDVSDRAALAKVLDTIRKQHGPIRAIIHGAGYEKSGRFSKKKFETYDRTMLAKVDGAAALMELTAADPIEVFVGFGSISGRFGGTGQVDYCIANDMLCKLVAWYRHQRPGVRATVLSWHAWDEVGMAVRPEIRHVKLTSVMRFMPVAEGAGHFLHEIQVGCPEVESVITDWRYYKMIYPDAAPSALAPSRSPWLTNVEVKPQQEATASIALAPTTDPFLSQHVLRGRPLFPLVMVLEAFQQIAGKLCAGSERVVAIENVTIPSPLRLLSDQPISIRVTAQRLGNSVETRLMADVVNQKGRTLKADEVRFIGQATITAQPIQTPSAMLEDLTVVRWGDASYLEDKQGLYHGPVFRYIRSYGITDSYFYARIETPPLEEIMGPQTAAPQLPVVLIDACLYAAGVNHWRLADGAISVPQSLGSVTVHRLPRTKEMLTARVVRKSHDATNSLSEVILFGEEGTIALTISGYRAVALPGIRSEVRALA